MKNKSISIIGGGATGIVFLNQLIEMCKKNRNIFSQVYIIDKHLNDGGLAYSTANNNHILNMSIGTMSAVASEDEHLHKWLINMGYPSDKNAYVSRRCYLRYLQNLFTETLKDAESLGIKVNIICACATNVKKVENLFLIETNNNDHIVSDYLILAIGTNFSDHYNLDGTPGYIRNPYIIDSYDYLLKEKEVSILGTNLSAVDLLFSLDDIGFEGRINLISRNGFLPFAKADSFSKDIDFKSVLRKIENDIESNKSDLTADKLIDIFKNEILIATGENIFDYIPSIIDPVKQLEISLKNATSGKSEYQNIFQNVNDTISLAWNYLSHNEKVSFKKKYGVMWNLLRSPIPLVNAKKLYSVLQRRNVIVHDKVADIKYENGIYCILKSNGEKLMTKTIINSTGLNFNFSKNPLISSIAKSGLLSFNELGGVYVDFHNNRIKDANGIYMNNAYGIGAISSGVHFVIHSVERSAKKCANAINCIFLNEECA